MSFSVCFGYPYRDPGSSEWCVCPVVFPIPLYEVANERDLFRYMGHRDMNNASFLDFHAWFAHAAFLALYPTAAHSTGSEDPLPLHLLPSTLPPDDEIGETVGTVYADLDSFLLLSEADKRHPATLLPPRLAFLSLLLRVYRSIYSDRIPGFALAERGQRDELPRDVPLDRVDANLARAMWIECAMSSTLTVFKPRGVWYAG